MTVLTQSAGTAYRLVLVSNSIHSKQASVMVVGVEGHVAFTQIIQGYSLCQLAGHLAAGSSVLVPCSQHCLQRIRTYHLLMPRYGANVSAGRLVITSVETGRHAAISMTV